MVHLLLMTVSQECSLCSSLTPGNKREMDTDECWTSSCCCRVCFCLLLFLEAIGDSMWFSYAVLIWCRKNYQTFQFLFRTGWSQMLADYWIAVQNSLLCQIHLNWLHHCILQTKHLCNVEFRTAQVTFWIESSQNVDCLHYTCIHKYNFIYTCVLYYIYLTS